VDLAGQPHRFAEQGAGFVDGAGVVLAQQAGEGGFGALRFFPGSRPEV